ncbi:DUF4886 domain-containing protein [Coraliomargarita sp. SDUM461004]|uniref:DUF4886 domain-containing protein n=1 Tax=Thalassobacterium sedimentorum TaxID=3041258 RepID=A0ABU1AMM4_9BACT|nr:DUF4886 domain-containing protein [Coraliomargarita sp. SDUM461004]MDQ8196062.1 DUF4886 domain-containing protein [Coraliomargarita sp. SDUM461004]
MKLYKKILFFLLISLSAGTLSAGEAPLRILGVGNSFTRNSMRYLPQIIKSNPDLSADVAYAYIGGCPLDKHVSLAEAHELDATKGKAYLYNMNGEDIRKQVPLKEMLEDGEWDYITIQQVSSKSFKIDTFYPYTERLIAYIKQYAPDAEIVIHETWAHSIDSYRVKSWGLKPDAMYADLHAAYAQVAEEFGLRVIPVGTAFQNAKKEALWDYQPTTIDTKTLVYPADQYNLPDQSKSLHKIFYWRKNNEGNMYVANDGYHAGKYGEYLGALVWYEFFFNADAREVSYKPNDFSDEQAVSLRQVAHETMHAQ